LALLEHLGEGAEGVRNTRRILRQALRLIYPFTLSYRLAFSHYKLSLSRYVKGACGACTVHLGGVATRSSVVPVSLIGTRKIVTIEAMADDPVGRVVQNAWVTLDVVQCGYCQSGQIMSAVALLKSIPKPTDTNIEESMGGNLCRCGTYVRIRQAIKAASHQLK
jgi:isoquinoline 1-oxidoreductase subunit alpha